jgi:hypothetical protein
MSVAVTQAFDGLKKAKANFEDLKRGYGVRGREIVDRYLAKIEWIYSDFMCVSDFPQSVRDGLRKEWNSDAYAPDAIYEGIIKLSPEKRELVLEIVDALLEGKEIAFAAPENKRS